MDDQDSTGGQAERLRRFSSEIAALGGSAPALRRERLLLRLGVALVVAGLACAGAAYGMSHGTTNELQQRDAIVVALFGMASTTAGGIVFLRYSLGRFLRFWLARLLYEQQHRPAGAFGTPQGAERSPDGHPEPVQDTAPAPRSADGVAVTRA